VYNTNIATQANVATPQPEIFTDSLRWDIRNELLGQALEVHKIHLKRKYGVRPKFRSIDSATGMALFKAAPPCPRERHARLPRLMQS
jgi:hypothetical protein